MLPVQDGLVGTNPAHALVVAVVLVALTVPIALRHAHRERQEWLIPMVLGSLLLHFVGAVAQIIIVRAAYENSADFHLYDGQGRDLSRLWLSGHFQLPDRDIPGTGSVIVVTAAVYCVTGVDQLGGFFVFSWFAVLGSLAFYKAFRTALPEAGHARYAAMIFLLPSLWYWPTVAGKEAVMMLALGGMALGAARLLRGSRSGLWSLGWGVVLGSMVRPHEVAMVIGAFAVAVVVRKRAATLASPVAWAATAILIVGLGAVMALYTARYLGVTSLSSEAIVEVVNEANQSTQGTGAGYGSSHSSWNISPLYFPYDVVLVLLKPLPWEVASFGQALAALENLSLVALFVLSWRSLLAVPGHLRKSPFTVMALVYSIGFIYLFSALANVGLLVRERTLLFPFLFVLFALEPWGLRRRKTRFERAPATHRPSTLDQGHADRGVHHGR